MLHLGEHVSNPDCRTTSMQHSLVMIYSSEEKRSHLVNLPGVLGVQGNRRVIIKPRPKTLPDTPVQGKVRNPSPGAHKQVDS